MATSDNIWLYVLRINFYIKMNSISLQNYLFQPISFKWRVTVSGELMFLESYDNCDVKNTVTLLL